uniref:caspase family protein n=1 Tax=Candidatus Electronema sp. TaxID=2698783 RepID=UPI0040570104
MQLIPFLLTLLLAAAAVAGEPPAAPLLRIETGRHTATIKRIAADSQGRWVATASDDKTLRLWDAQDGSLLQTFRLPSGAGDEGKLFAAAMDPAGGWLAAGGWTGYDWEGTNSIYIIDRATGQMRQRIDGLENVINHLCVSPDGRYLAATLGDTGLRVYDARNSFASALADRDYGNDSYGCAFSPDSRSLISTCYDGQLRLYRLEGGSFRKEKQAAAQGGKQPYSVAFHPAGRRIAVGFIDSTAVTVIDAERLTQLSAADTSGIDNGSLSSVAWSADGSFLFAGGRRNDFSPPPLFRWADKGQGKRESWQAAGETVMNLKPLPDGSLLVGAGDPALLRYDSQGRKQFDLRPNLPDMRNKLGDSFQLSADGRQVAFGLGYGGEEPVCFDLHQRQLRKGQCKGSLTAPRTEASGLKIEGWKNEYNPKLNGEPLALAQYERSRSVAIAPDNQHVLLGTEWWLRLFDREGKEVWQQPVPGAAWGVNISGDGRVAVAAFGDGTIRWFRLSDGEPLLSLFVTKDGGQWVAWTPGGWYDSSPGGDSLIGWQVNNGKDQLADFFPASQFRERYYRPDVTAKVLETLDESKAVAQADAALGGRRSAPAQLALPPAIELLTPADGSSFSSPTLSLRYRVRIHDNGPPVVAVQVRVDGGFRQRSVVTQRSDKEWEGSVDVTLPARDMTLSLIAENAESAMSPPAAITLRWQGGKDALKPVLYLLAVGVDEYDAPEINLHEGKKYLKYASADARAFAALMMEQAGPKKLYREVKPRVLVNKDADRTAVLEGLEWIEQQATGNDVAMVFLAGHGKLDAKEDYYFLPKDFKPWRYLSSGVPYDAINSTVTRVRGKALFLIDTCYSGKAAGQRGGGEVDMTKIINDLSAAENGVIVLSATTGHQTAQERDEWGHGAFTKALLEALRGDANYNADKALTVSEIRTYIADRVKTLTDSQQTPAVVIPKNVSDFPVFALP